MAKLETGAGDVFDVRKVRRLVELMNAYDLAEIDLRQGDQRIQLRKRIPPEAGGDLSYAAAPAAPAAGRPSATAPAVAPPEVAGGQDSAERLYITSPTVGTYYSAANPDSAAFVQVGDHVGPESVVCVIEAMKVFNEIQAECAGRIVATLVENGAPVEYGQRLFEVDPNG